MFIVVVMTITGAPHGRWFSVEAVAAEIKKDDAKTIAAAAT